MVDETTADTAARVNTQLTLLLAAGWEILLQPRRAGGQDVVALTVRGHMLAVQADLEHRRDEALHATGATLAAALAPITAVLRRCSEAGASLWPPASETADGEATSDA